MKITKAQRAAIRDHRFRIGKAFTDVEALHSRVREMWQDDENAQLHDLMRALKAAHSALRESVLMMQSAGVKLDAIKE